MKKVLIQFKNLGKDLRNINVDIVADAVDSQPSFNNALSIESFKLTGQGVERQISDSATKLYLIPQYHEYFISGGNPSISEISQLKFTNVRDTTFLNNQLYTAEVSDQNYLSQYILWKSGSTPRFNLTNGDPLVNGGIFTRGYTGSLITGQFIGVGTGYSGTTINIVGQKNNKLKVYNTPGISGFAGTYTSGTYRINNTLTTGFKNDQNIIGNSGGFFIFKNASPNEWRAVELNSGGSIVENWYRNSGNDTFGYYKFIPPVTGWRLGQNIDQKFNPVPETYFGACNGYTFLYPETIFRVNSFNRVLSLLKFYSGGFLNNNGTSSTFPNNTTIEDLFPTAYGEFFNKNFFYSNIINNDIYYLFNSITKSDNFLKWYVGKVNVSGSKYDYWISDSVEVTPDLTLESANIDFYSVNNEGNNFSVQTLSKYSNTKLFQTKELNIENYSGAIYLNNPTFNRQGVSVEDGGNTFANGTYIQSGTLNGRSRYVNVSSSLYDIIFSNIRTWDLRQSSGNQFYPIYRSKTRNNLAPTGEWTSLSARIPQFAQITGSGSYTLKGTVSNFNSLDSCINDNGTVIVSANNSFGQPRGSFTIFTGRNANFIPKQTIEGSFPSLFYPPVTNGFANSIDLSSDGSIIAVGGYQVKIYSGNPNGLGQNYALQQTINTPFTTYNVTDNNVAINGDANVLVIGSPYFNSGDGRVEIYRKTGNNIFGLQQTIIGGYGGIRWGFSTGENTQGGFRLGDNISLSQNGRVLAIGGYLSGMGAAYVYWRNSTESLFSSRYSQWGSPSRLLGKWATSVNDDGSVVCIGGYGASILRGNANVGSYRVLNNGTLANLITSTRVHTNGDGSKIIIGGYGQSAAIFTGNKNLTGTDASAFWSSGYALRLTGTFGSRNSLTSTNDMGTILVNSSPLNIYQQDNVIPVLTGSTLITGNSPTPESFYSSNDIVNDLNNQIYEFKKINSGKFSGPYFEGDNYIFANPEFKIDSYSGFGNLSISGTNVRPSGISGMKLYKVDSTFLGNSIYTDLLSLYRIFL